MPVCPVDCIRPVAGDDTDMLYIDPEACIDCGACFDECPVDAIHYGLAGHRWAPNVTAAPRQHVPG